MVYHYTTINALNDIINNYRESEDKEHFVFWASSVYSMNDSTEMQYGWEVALRNFQQYEDSHNVPNEKRLSVFMEQIRNSDVANVFYQHFYREELTPFVLSFSENRDCLPMWTMYGGKGTGACLCFDEKKLKAEDNLFHNMPLLNVLYVNQTDNSKVSTKSLGEIITNQYEYLLDKKEVTDNEKIISIGSILPVISAYLKNASFKYEHELRIPIIANDIRKSVFFRSSTKGNIIPFIKVPIPISCLKEIILGPCIQSDSIKRELYFDMSICGLKIPIYSSDIPYRDY